MVDPKDRPLEHTSAWHTVATALRERLSSGRWRWGDRLPAERLLAEQLDMSRPSLREGLRVLEALGLIQTTSGQGRQSRAELVPRPDIAIGSVIRLHTELGALVLSDVVAARIDVESATTKLVAERIGTAGSGPTGSASMLFAGMAAAEDLLVKMRESEISRDQFLDLDASFHLALARAAGNPVLAAMVGGLIEAELEYSRYRAAGITDWDAVSAGFRLQHAAILTALRRGDGVRAMALLIDHIHGFHRGPWTAARTPVHAVRYVMVDDSEKKPVGP